MSHIDIGRFCSTEPHEYCYTLGSRAPLSPQGYCRYSDSQNLPGAGGYSDVDSDPDEWFNKMNNGPFHFAIETNGLSDSNDEVYPRRPGKIMKSKKSWDINQKELGSCNAEHHFTAISPNRLGKTDELSDHDGPPQAPQLPQVCLVPTPSPKALADQINIMRPPKEKLAPNPWSATELFILVRTAELGVSWEKTMRLLPGKTRDAARSRQKVLKSDGLLHKDLPNRPITCVTAQSVLDGVVQIAGKTLAAEETRRTADKKVADEALAKAIIDKKEATIATREDTRRRGQEEAERAQSKKIGRLDHTWTAERDEFALRQWMHGKNDSEIAKLMPGKNVTMIAARRNYLRTSGQNPPYDRPAPIYAQLFKEFNPGLH